MSEYAAVVALLDSDAPVAQDDVRRWIDSGDLLTWSAVHALMERGRIDADPDFLRSYLLRCIEENPQPGGLLHGGYAAAWALAARMKEWRREGGRRAAMLRGIAAELEKLYRRGDSATRNRVLCGVLEHAFEDPALRPFFSTWDRDEELTEAYTLALDWGVSHEE